MPEQIQKTKQSQKQREDDIDEAPEQIDVMSIEGILDEIDEVLEENAEEFVRSYIQKGGQ